MLLRIAAGSLFIALSCSGCFGQSGSCEVKKNGQMIGRDDSGSDRKPFIGSLFPEEQTPLLSDSLPAVDWAVKHRICAFGWLDGGLTSASNTTGQAAEAPTPDRFSDQAMLNAAWLTVERGTAEEEWSWGFRSDFYAGSDAALLRPLNFFGPEGPRWGTDFRQAYLMLHTPIFFSRGIDWTIGRINLPTGAETGLAPYQQLYSRAYFWIHDETGGTALLATLHINPTLDLVSGIVAGYSTYFELRGRAPSYIGRVLYHPGADAKDQLIATIYSGPKPLAAVSGHVGTWQTLAELQFRRVWSPRLTQIFQAHDSVDAEDPQNASRSSVTRGAFVLTAYKINRSAALHSRLEWFTDPNGVRTAIPGTYGEATLGVTLAPAPWLEARPEVRGDFAGQASFGSVDSTIRHRNQFSFAVELVAKARFF